MKIIDGLSNFIEFYNDFNVEDQVFFNKVYDPLIKFKDPFHEIKGNNKLYQYFKKIIKNLSYCKFSITEVVERNEVSDVKGQKSKTAVVFWDMSYKHKFLNKGAEIKLPGCSLIRYNDRVTFHQDYFDTSAMLYRNIPILGSLIRFVEGKI